jgi:hypothetical protein
MTAARQAWAADLLHFWFHKLRPAQWFGRDDAVDAALRRRFAPLLTGLSRQPLRKFLSDPLTARAAVLLFDQVPRNSFRGDPRAFATDRLAAGHHPRRPQTGLAPAPDPHPAPVPAAAADAQRRHCRPAPIGPAVRRQWRCRAQGLCPQPLPHGRPLWPLPAPQRRARPPLQPGRSARGCQRQRLVGLTRSPECRI